MDSMAKERMNEAEVEIPVTLDRPVGLRPSENPETLESAREWLIDRLAERAVEILRREDEQTN